MICNPLAFHCKCEGILLKAVLIEPLAKILETGSDSIGKTVPM
jgi:hypothetical protein